MFPEEIPACPTTALGFKEVLGSLSLTGNGQRQLLSPQVGKIPRWVQGRDQQGKVQRSEKTADKGMISRTRVWV